MTNLKALNINIVMISTSGTIIDQIADVSNASSETSAQATQASCASSSLQHPGDACSTSNFILLNFRNCHANPTVHGRTGLTWLDDVFCLCYHDQPHHQHVDQERNQKHGQQIRIMMLDQACHFANSSAVAEERLACADYANVMLMQRVSMMKSLRW